MLNERILLPPQDYIDRIQNGCILDPSVFYSESNVLATTELLHSLRPHKVYLPSHLFSAYESSNWISFYSTLSLWSADYEKISEAWYASDDLMKELQPLAIAIPDKEVESNKELLTSSI